MLINVQNLEETLELGRLMGSAMRGREAVELISDLGGGKTAFVKGLASGMGCRDVVQSPTFTISRIYNCDRGLELHHFDFYRLSDPGIMSAELFESLNQSNAVVAIEWGAIVHEVLPKNHITIQIKATGDTARAFDFVIPKGFEYITQVLSNFQQNRNIA